MPSPFPSSGTTSSSSGNWWNAPSPTPTSSGSTAGLPKIGDVQTGRYSIDVSSPGGLVESLAGNDKQTGDFIAGLGEALFGQKTGLINSIPLVGSPIGDVVRGISALPGVGLPAAGISGVFGAAGNILSHIPTGWIPGIGADQMFASLPDTPEKRAIEAAANADFLGGGNLKYDYVQKVIAAQNEGKYGSDGFLPTALGTSTAGSLGGMLVQLLDVFSLPGMTVQRGLAGANGAQRLAEINQIAATNPADLTPVERTVYEKLRSGAWSEDHALDYLTEKGAGLAHSGVGQVAASILTDPTTWLSGGAGIASKLARGAKAAEEAGLVGSRLGTAILDIQRSELGPALHAVRTAIDPLSAIGGKDNIGNKVVNALTDSSRAEAIHVGFGEANVLAVYKHPELQAIMPKVMSGLSGGLDNAAREFVGQRFAAQTLATQGEAALRALMKDGAIPADVIDGLVTNMSKGAFHDYTGYIRKVRQQVVVLGDLSQRMAAEYGRTVEEWASILEPMSNEQRAVLHWATYNDAENALMTAVGKSMQVTAQSGKDVVPLERIVVGNARHMDEEAGKALLAAVKAAKDDNAKLQLLKAAAENHDNLGFRIIPKDVKETVRRATNELRDMIDNNDLPRTVTDAELAKYPELKAWADARPTMKIVFRPPDDRMWREAMDSEGIIRYVNPWVGHAPNDGKSLYRPGSEIARNLVGTPLGTLVGKPLDWLEVGMRSVRQQVSGTTIRIAAKARFEGALIEKYGMTKDEASTLWAALEDAAQVKATSVRGMSGQNMWDAIGGGESIVRSKIPARFIEGVPGVTTPLTKRDFMLEVLRAFEGDLRLVGLTQKFTGALKTWLAEKAPEFAGGNFAGQFAETIYPLIRFKFHPMFQAQEKIEGWVLNAQRGVPANFRGRMTKAGLENAPSDELNARVWENLVGSKVISATDFDMAEYSTQALLGSRTAKVFGELPDAAASMSLDVGPGGLTGIARQKRINYLRLWQQKLGPSLRETLGEDRWLVIKQHYGIADDGELAVKYLAEQMDQSLKANVGNDLADYSRNIADADMWKPLDIGELRPLNLDGLAYDMGKLPNVEALREAIRRGDIEMDTVVSHLLGSNASPEYVNRVKLALEFDTPQFFRDVKDAYNLTSEEYRAFRDLITSAATQRGLKPTEYLSGVFAPKIKMTTTADLSKAQEVKAQVNFLRTVRGKGANADLLYAEMAKAMRGHLDPSLLKTLAKDSGVSGGAPDRLLVAGGSASGSNVPMALPHEPSFTIKATPGEPVRAVINGEVKRLNGRALARLQGVPDSYPLPADEALARTIIGNGVPPPLMKAVTEPLVPLMGPNPRGVTLFSGGGLAEIGVPKVKFIGAVEYNPKIAENYAKAHGPHVVVGDVRGVDFNQWKDAEYLHASPVCKNFSGAKAQAGEVALDIETADATVRAIREINPRVVTVENVPRYQGSEALKLITDELTAKGYKWDINVFDAADYGVPQHRNRMLLRATREGDLPPLPAKQPQVGWYDAIKDLPLATDAKGLARWQTERLAKQGVNFSAFDWGAKHDEWLAGELRKYAGGAVHPSPDVERALRFMAKTADDAAFAGGSPEWRAIMAATRKAGTQGGVPYNYTEHLALNSVTERMKEMEQDAFRTHYFARTRSVLERSVNHPFFGLYPASYMWGKLLPEMVRFVAKEPFGVRTGAAAYALNDMRNSIAMQRELDPEFDAMMEKAGRSPAALLLSYMLPAVPWDIPAVAPQWMRDLADQGMKNKLRRERGLAPVNIDPSSPLGKVADYLNPVASDLAKISAVGKQVGDTVLGTKQEQVQRGGPQVQVPVVGATIGGSGQKTPAETLAPVLQDNMTLLQDWLNGGKLG
jgi:site-specific DNA-cytosine methylase